MDNTHRAVIALAILATLAATGCNSPYHSDRGALFGGLLGAGTGAIIGDAAGNAGAGTAIGAGIGALTGAAIGQGMDEVEARNRAMIEAQMGRQIAAGAVSIEDVISMSQAGVAEELIVTHVQSHGMSRPLDTNDLIFLQQQNVGTRVVKAMQEPPRAQPLVVSQATPPPVIVEEYHYGVPVFGAPCYHAPPRHHYPRNAGVSWGMSFHN